MGTIEQLIIRHEEIIRLLKRVKELQEQAMYEPTYGPGPSQSSIPPATPPNTSGGDRPLARREKEIYDLLMAGLTPKQTADRLGIKIKNVYANRDKIRAKLPNAGI